MSTTASISEKEEVVRVRHGGELPTLMLHVLVNSRAFACLWFCSFSALVKLGPADWARVVFLEPALDALAIKGMTARQLATGCTVAALFQADVAVAFFAFLLLGQVGEELG